MAFRVHHTVPISALAATILTSYITILQQQKLLAPIFSDFGAAQKVLPTIRPKKSKTFLKNVKKLLQLQRRKMFVFVWNVTTAH